MRASARTFAGKTFSLAALRITSGSPEYATRANGSARVTFSPPASNGGSAITSYTATCASSNGGATGSVSGAASPIVVTGLTNGKTYTCTMFATNSFGDSAVSDATSAFVAESPSFATYCASSSVVS